MFPANWEAWAEKAPFYETTTTAPRYQSQDWLLYFSTVFTSPVFWRIFSHLLVHISRPHACGMRCPVLRWGMSLPGQHALCRAGVVCLHLLVAGAQHILRGRLMLRVLISSLTTVPHSLTAGALGLLLVFRTNTAYDRFWEVRLPPPLVPATFLHLLRSHFLKDIVLHVKSPTKRARKLWGALVNYTRDIARIAHVHLTGYERYASSSDQSFCATVSDVEEEGANASIWMLREETRPRAHTLGWRMLIWAEEQARKTVSLTR
eukprot:3565986-Rhodomonas_salina.3